MSSTNEIELDKIRTDGETQSRVRLDDNVIDEYRSKLESGITLPPVDVFYDGAEYWLADGFHRYHAHKQLQHDLVPCTLHRGKRRDAIIYACGANHTHGLRRTQEDRRKAVLTLLNDAEWSTYSTRLIAEMCHVSHELVRQLKKSHLDRAAVNFDTCAGPDRTRCLARDGKTYPAAQSQKRERECLGKTEQKPAARCDQLEREPGDDTDLIKAQRARSRINGREVITIKDRKAATGAWGVLVRFVDKLGRNDVSEELRKIHSMIGDEFLFNLSQQ